MLNGFFRQVVLAAMLFLTAATFNSTFATDRWMDDPRDLPRCTQRGPRTLDDEFTQLLYVKTTDYGVTWSSLTRAGDLSPVSPTATLLGDFSACIMNTNELCYAVFLPDAATPGVYACAGPSFTPTLAAPEGNNNFGYNYPGWTDIGRTPNGDLFIIIWGSNASGYNTFWGVKSTDNGATWQTPFVIATYPSLSISAQYPHISDVNSNNYCFALFQVPGTTLFDQYLLRFPVAGGAGTIYNTNQSSYSEVSYFTGNCKPIAYDPEQNALFICFRNSDLSGTMVGYSGNQGQSFAWFTIPGLQRYPSMALRSATQTPFVISNVGPPAVGQYHWAWYAFDEGDYGGGLWTDRDTMVVAPQPFDGVGPLYYQNQAYFWDALRGAGSHSLWGQFTPEAEWTSRTTDGGFTWTDFSERWNFLTDSLDPGTLSQNELVGGVNGIAYVITAGHILGTESAHFSPVDSTAVSYPVIVADATWWGSELLQGDEIGIFDDTLCVGAAVYFGNWPLTVTCWQADSALGLPGFVPGHHIAFRIWYSWWQDESPAIPTYLVGDSTFGFGTYTQVELAVVPSPGDIFLPQDSHDFGTVPVGGVRGWTLQIENVGDSDLNLTSISSDNQSFTPFPPFSGPELIPPWGSYSQLIYYFPADTNAHAATISITSDDPDEPTVTAGLQGHGIAHPPLDFTLQLPADGDSVDAEVAILTWQDTSDPDSLFPQRYDVWMDTLPDLSTAVQIRDSIDYTVITVGAWDNLLTYYWTVRATDNNTPGTWASDTFRFWLSGLSASDADQPLPDKFALDQNYPNPFNPSTTISLAVPQAGMVTLTLFDVAGRRVRTLSDGWREPGYHTLTLDGAALPSGVYFVRMTAPAFAATRKMILIK